MDKLKEIRIKQASGEYGPGVPIGAEAENIDIYTYDDVTPDGADGNFSHNLQDVIGSIYVEKEPEDASYKYMRGSIANQLAQASMRLDDLEYYMVEITSLTSNPAATAVQETNNQDNINVSFSWGFNKTSKDLTEIQFDGSVVDINARSISKTIVNPAKTAGYGTKTWTLKVTDKKAVNKGGNTVSKNITVTWSNGVYYGAAEDPRPLSEINSDFIKRLNKKLQTGRGISVTNMGATGGKYFWYAIPARLARSDKPTFTIGGFASDMDEVGTIAFTNRSDFEEDYIVYRTQNANPGTGSFSAN